MPNPVLKQAIKEAYASAPSDEVLLYTMELRHSSFTQPIRVVRDHQDFRAFLETGAPADAGLEVDFVALMFEFKEPDLSDQAAPELPLMIANVTPEIEENISAAQEFAEPIECTYRVYLASDPSGPQNDPPMHLEVKHCKVTDFQIDATCTFGNFNNKRFPSETYTTDKYPTL